VSKGPVRRSGKPAREPNLQLRDPGAFSRTAPAADPKTVYFRCREAESPTDAVQSVFQSMARDCSFSSLGSAFDHRPNVPLKPAPSAGFSVPVRELSAVYALATCRRKRRKVRRLMVLMAVPIAPMPSKPAEEVQKQFGARMRALRQQRGLSQEELAFSCNLDRTYIGSVERGERNISLVNIHTIAAALGVSPREFFID